MDVLLILPVPTKFTIHHNVIHIRKLKMSLRAENIALLQAVEDPHIEFQ